MRHPIKNLERLSGFKYSRDRSRFHLMHPILRMIFADMENWALDMGMPFICTATVTTKEDDIQAKRKSLTHRQGRAFDISLRGWKADSIAKFIAHFSEKYAIYAAVNNEGERVLIPDVNHGTAPHLHVQIHSMYNQGIELKSKEDS